ncbi:Tn3 family transposase [Streptomyces sp. NBC_00853]|nr:Tn3 family transposase [Streptomyces sp. NBC_01207]WTA22679.1 Tn3 family transposase [Streptomyces sp. NBC_00853]
MGGGARGRPGGLSLDEDAEQHLRELTEVLDATWKQMAERLEEAGTGAKISIEVQPNGRAKLNVEKLHALGEPKSLAWLRGRVEKMLPKIDLPDLLFEVHSWIGFLDAFVHLGDGKTRMKDLTTPVVALLVSEACNIGMTPVINPNYEALTRARLVHVDQYYLRADTIARLSPLKHKNLNVLGRYSFTAQVPNEGLRPLRDPDAVELDDDDDG